jgi:hypothetical protein
MEATRRDGVPAIEQAGVAVVPLVRTGGPREEVVGADGHVNGTHSQRAVFDSGGPAQPSASGRRRSWCWPHRAPDAGGAGAMDGVTAAAADSPVCRRGGG